ncbi:MAG: UDP-glucose 4-epimerase GalE [Chloroflexi bacterium]|uniref:UDP-glucose 4-epimerase n=1 Tax=Candidatus Chlorohelix allophototropha TaxID=3003348 RepID=A0A8T7M774_9CHLR|nr:UDP-glucose 4-epimerase GalE [Chloroflexota bacterium]WJW69874.1 UDP-glucose 4-epimerase GalE [Chloroflexota bacterium L227-S17]
MRVLVTGGAGYIGSHTIMELLKQQHEVIVLDSLETGYIEALVELGIVNRLVVGSTQDAQLLDRVFREYKPEAVIHFAAYKSVAESIENPNRYFQNNVFGTTTLLDTMVRHGVKNLVFSSTCAIFGTPSYLPVQEHNNNTNPENPYGESKLIVEQILRWYDRAYGLKSVCLRYFNVAGAAEGARIGEDWTKAQNLIPVVLKAALGVIDSVQVFGSDYPTHDGTCIRDYIHVVDLAQAHILSMEYLLTTNTATCYNLGTGKGSSVMDVIQTVRNITGENFKVIMSPRRPGDPAAIWADSFKAVQELGWKTRYNLEDMIRSAYQWHKSHPNGWRQSDSEVLIPMG